MHLTLLVYTTGSHCQQSIPGQITPVNPMNVVRIKIRLLEYLSTSPHIRWVLLILVTTIATIIVYPNLVVPKHQYKLGDIAERDIKAPKDFFIEDTLATEISRRQAAETVLSVYDFDDQMADELHRQIIQTFAMMRALIEYDQHPKPISPAPVEVPLEPLAPNAASERHSPPKEALDAQLKKLKPRLEEALRIPIDPSAFDILAEKGFSDDIAKLITEILDKIFQNGVVTNKEMLLKESPKGIILRSLVDKKERVIQNIKAFYGPDQAKTMVRIVGQPLLKDVAHNLREVIVDLSQQLIQPNITLNRSETEERLKTATDDIKPVLYKIKAGEMLLREGERVTDAQLEKIKALQTQFQKEQAITSGLGTAMLITCLLVTFYVLCAKRQTNIAAGHNKDLVFLSSVYITFCLLANVSMPLVQSLAANMPYTVSENALSYCIPIASGAMLTCIFMGLEMAIPIAMLLAICAAAIFENRFEFFIYFLTNGAMAAYWIQSCRERKVFIKAGLKIGLLNVILVAALNLYMEKNLGLGLLWDWAFAFLGGIGAGVVTAGLAPLIEVTFDYSTDIKLLELANLDRPILRRLMLEAPGTYHHSVIVGSLVEAAAAEIGANPLLGKVCGYYHDIGKIKKPLYFIENQTDGKNKHDKLAPSMSSLILIAHVKDGVEIAKAHKLGQAIVDTIRQHHGTSLISFFYEKAKQLKSGSAVNIDDYRYPGPRPQTREAGLVMLADVVEAASRTLENPTPSRIQGLVQRLINKIFSDGQLDHCELTLKDLHNIAKSFNKILNGIHHHRIEYADKLTVVNGKAKDGSSDRKQTKQVSDTPKENKAKGENHLKRLGLS